MPSDGSTQSRKRRREYNGLRKIRRRCGRPAPHRRAGVRVADVHRLVKEDDGSVGVPAAWVVVEADVLGDAAGAKLHEQTGQ
ncbi:hypothetical protein KC328_g2 [Hortaea werneckii]|nr:hypothetical protein KC328_g2 [Hortaea werneckii]